MKRSVLLVVAVLLLGGCGSALAVGECVIVEEVEEADDEAAVLPAGCEDESATHEVLQVVDDTEACVEVAGVTYAVERGDEEVVCLGDQGADHAAGVNAAVIGDCLNDGEPPGRVACDGSDASFEVVGRFVAVPQLEAEAAPDPQFGPSSPCDGIDGWTQGSYAWSMNSSDPMFAGFENVDVLLCLGDV